MVLFSTAALAEEPVEKFKLGEIVISDDADDVVESVSTVRRVTPEDIKNQGARTLDEAVSLVPGLSVRTGPRGIPFLDIRGMKTRHVRLLLNGVPLNSTFDGQFDASFISVENIAEIKVTPGVSSELYGPGAMAGVINIITKKAPEGFSGTAGSEYGSGDALLNKFTAGGGSDKARIFAAGSRYTTNGYPMSGNFDDTDMQSNDIRENSDRTRTNLFGNYVVTPSLSTEIGMAVNYFEGEYGKPYNAYEDPNNLFLRGTKYERIEHTDGMSAQLGFEHELDIPLTLRTYLFANVLNERDARYDDENFDSQDNKGSYTQDMESSRIGLNLQAAYDFDALGALTFSGYAAQENFDSELNETGKGGKVTTTITERTVNLYTAALEHEFKPIDDLGVVIGGGLHHQDRMEVDGQEKDDTDYTYTVGSYYDFLETWRVRASHARKIRFPSLRQLYNAGEGNPELETEKTLHYELALDKRLPGIKSMVSVGGFWIDAEDFIERDETDPNRLNQNFEEVRMRGVEASFESTYIPNFLFRATYTLLDTEDLGDDAYRDELQNRPEHNVTVEGKYSFDFGLSIFVSYEYLGKQYVYESKAPYDKGELEDYSVVDIKISQTLLDDALELYVGVDNLLDEDYEYGVGLPGSGRSWYGGFEYRF